jgi:hypothetical protein
MRDDCTRTKASVHLATLVLPEELQCILPIQTMLTMTVRADLLLDFAAREGDLVHILGFLRTVALKASCTDLFFGIHDVRRREVGFIGGVDDADAMTFHAVDARGRMALRYGFLLVVGLAVIGVELSFIHPRTAREGKRACLFFSGSVLTNDGSSKH